MKPAGVIVTGSENVTAIELPGATSDAPLAGLLPDTDGASSPPAPWAFCGSAAFGPVKSAGLSSVSCVPSMRSKLYRPSTRILVGRPVSPAPSRQRVGPDAGTEAWPAASSITGGAGDGGSSLTSRTPPVSVMPTEKVWSPGTLPE